MSLIQVRSLLLLLVIMIFCGNAGTQIEVRLVKGDSSGSGSEVVVDLIQGRLAKKEFQNLELSETFGKSWSPDADKLSGDKSSGYKIPDANKWEIIKSELNSRCKDAFACDDECMKYSNQKDAGREGKCDDVLVLVPSELDGDALSNSMKIMRMLLFSTITSGKCVRGAHSAISLKPWNEIMDLLSGKDENIVSITFFEQKDLCELLANHEIPEKESSDVGKTIEDEAFDRIARSGRISSSSVVKHFLDSFMDDLLHDLNTWLYKFSIAIQDKMNGDGADSGRTTQWKEYALKSLGYNLDYSHILKLVLDMTSAKNEIEHFRSSNTANLGSPRKYASTPVPIMIKCPKLDFISEASSTHASSTSNSAELPHDHIDNNEQAAPPQAASDSQVFEVDGDILTQLDQNADAELFLPQIKEDTNDIDISKAPGEGDTPAEKLKFLMNSGFFNIVRNLGGSYTEDCDKTTVHSQSVLLGNANTLKRLKEVGDIHKLLKLKSPDIPSKILIPSYSYAPDGVIKRTRPRTPRTVSITKTVTVRVSSPVSI